MPGKTTIAELLTRKALTPSAVVKLPNSYFEKWRNHPFLAADMEEKLTEHEELAGYYDLHRINSEIHEIQLTGHPYDLGLKDFIKCFSCDMPEEFREFNHLNGSKYLPYEAYIPYWRGYIILEAHESCKYIDRYLDKKSSSERFIAEVQRIDNQWGQSLSHSFDRLSHYISVASEIDLSPNAKYFTYKELALHALHLSNTTLETLISDFEPLLTLYKKWERAITTDGSKQYQNGINLLKRDIYYLFEWCCGLGKSEEEILSKWSISDRQPRMWADLSDALDFEELRQAKCFERFTEIYCKGTTATLENTDLASCFQNLSKIEASAPWLRAYFDLHQSINRKGGPIRFEQPRILNHLLIFAIRTEMLVRAMYEKRSGKPAEYRLEDTLNNFGSLLPYSASKVVEHLHTLKKLTNIGDKPADIFEKLRNSRKPKNWNKEQCHLLDSITFFITSRNYFAHHHYKDTELDNHLNKICLDVVQSCLHTILYLEIYSRK